MNKFKEFFKRSYVYILLSLFYIPLVVGAVFSFNSNPNKGGFLTTWNKFSLKQWQTLFAQGRDIALINSIIIAVVVSLLVITLSLITVFALYRQKNKMIRGTVTSTANIPLINPDNITAIGLVLVFALFFGVIASDSEGLWRAIIGHTIMALPYGISLMYPRSEKFNLNLYEASQDLGYSKIKSWFKTYFIYMMPSIIMVALVSSFLSFDDFIITRTVSNTSTLGLKLYEGAFEPWALVIGAILLTFTILGNIVYVAFKAKTTKKLYKNKKKLNSNYNTNNLQDTNLTEIIDKND
ncbi:ABC transporter permease [Mycoplasma crocodyli]|uniref:Spermidine/putrescine transport system permease PotC n=1 Tax=Mycoplasma crocodyli (strain ATCC 51981 / MP145) TaxID=512564 RepID=D5E562_MYCCM|nr:ABC transporter permease subunit [Mycoplasma crocodyli]ADE19686.1 spermidine/putrescine transport system permease PotC [Mycoplasma crocodyli MP145]